MPGSSYDMALGGEKGNTKINANLEKNLTVTISAPWTAAQRPEVDHCQYAPRRQWSKPSLLCNLSYSTWGKDNSLHSTVSQASVSFSKSHGKPGKISIALSKHGMTKGLLDNHSSSWRFIQPMAPLGIMLLEKSSLVKLSSFSPPRESASEPAGKWETYYPLCTSGTTLLNLSGMLRENEGDWVPAPWGNPESQFLLAKSEQRHWKGDAGHCGNPALHCRAF